MKMIPMPEPGDKVSYLGEGEVEHGKIVESVDTAFDMDENNWQVAISWDTSGQNSVDYVVWNDELKLWVTT